MVRHLEKRVQQVELDAQEKVCKEVYIVAIGSFVLFPEARTYSHVLFICLFVFILVSRSGVKRVTFL